MHRYLLRRVVFAVPTFLGAVTLVFLIMRVVPGDVTAAILGAQMDQEGAEEMVQQLREKLGLDDPLHVQYGRWLWGAIRFDFGRSLYTGETITNEIKARYPVTLNLMVMVIVVSTAIAIPSGLVAALKQDSWVDYGLRIISIGALSIPNFFIATLIILGLLIYFQLVYAR